MASTFSKKSATFRPRSPAMTQATPKNRAKTMIWSMFAFTMDSIGLEGKMSSRTSSMGFAALASALSPSMFIPAPALTRLPSARPMTMAMAVVTR